MQVDDNSNLVIAGTTPALMSFTIDGISSVDVENSGPIAELFPSFNSISEIRVSETNNNAEYSGVADVTTTSRAGTNDYHGGVFENLENTALTAGNPFTGKPSLHMNDFGGFAGGPVRIPHLYNGRDKTFFFGSYEGLRLPREFPLVESFPSLDMRNGNLWNYLVAHGRGRHACRSTTTMARRFPAPALRIARFLISPVAANVIKYLMPLPNSGPADSFQNNYVDQFPRADFEQPVRCAHRSEYYVEAVHLWAVHLQEPLGDDRAHGQLRWLLRYQLVALAGRHRRSRSRIAG